MAAVAKDSAIPVTKFHFVPKSLAFVAADWIAVPTLLSSVVYFASQLTVTFYIVIFMKVI